MTRSTILTCLIMAAATLGAATGSASTLPCAPCAGIQVDDPSTIVDQLAREPRLVDDAQLFVAWTAPLDGTTDHSIFENIRNAGAQPWVRVVIRAAQPIADNLDRLESELEGLAQLASTIGSGTHIQVAWVPERGSVEPRELAFVLKRAAVVVTGAASGAAFVAGPLQPDPEALRALYQEDVAAYLDGVAFAPGEDSLAAALAALLELDPGKLVTVDAEPWPEDPATTIARAAERTAAGVSVTFFDAGDGSSADLTPLKVLATEFQGDLSYSQYANPTGAHDAWAFVRAEDLGLRIIAVPPPDQSWFELRFDDAYLRSPFRINPATGEHVPAGGVRRTAGGLAVAVDDPGAVVLLSLERPTAEELEGFDELIRIAGDRQMPVEEILRRLQAFEDDQARRLDHYQATRTLHLRFQGVRGSFEASYKGDFFFRTDEEFDWVWRDFFVAGVKWRSKRLPEVPLIQPEKVASQPIDIRLTADYSYRLRGTATVDGRDCWVVDFKPIDPVPGRSLYQGTVWVDREVYARVRTRATQIGLEGEVVSNEEIQVFAPFDANGQPAAWSRENFFLPVRVTGQQILSLLSLTLPVELEAVLSDIRINGEDFNVNRELALASDHTMVRDTENGLRYLKKDKSGQRVVQEKQRSSRLFLLGGVFWDESVDYPLPLLGVNYLDLDFKDTGNQLNVFFAGAYLNAGMSDPRLFGSRWNGGANLSGVFFERRDELYREGEVASEEDVKSRTAGGSLYVGRPLGNFVKLNAAYRFRFDSYSRADDTAEDFVLPQDNLTHTFETGLTYSRSGYRLELAGSVNKRTDWEFWGLPGNDEYDPDQKDYTRWQVTFAKTWWLQKYRNIGLSFEHLDGDDLDRFSGYDFGLFGDSTVGGYPSGLVRATQASGAHLSFGINYLEQIRFDVEADAVWATNEITGLDNELLAGIAIGGSLTLPWQLVTNFEIGYALAGPGEGSFAARIFFLRLFPRK